MRAIILLAIFAAIIPCITSLNCYICNSLQKPECVDDYKGFLKVCPVKSFSGLKAVKPVGCRVTRQYVNDETSVVRECAYTGEDIIGKSNKGSLGVSRVYSQCSDKPGCNSSSTFSILPIFLISIAAVFKIIC